MDKKIKELAAKYNVPEQLLKEAMQLEKEKVNLNNRRLVPKLINLIERYTETSQ
jgi:hypothetical protein